MNYLYVNKNYPLFFIAIIFFLSTLWDFRLNDQIRIFDLLSFLIIIGLSFYLYMNKSREIYKSFLKKSDLFPFLIVVLIWAIYGAINYHHKSSVAIICGVSILIICNLVFNLSIHFGRFLVFIIGLHLLAFYFQFLSYIFFHYKLDYLSIINITSRIFPEDGAFFYRASGLFREPSSYALNMFLMLVILLKFYKKHIIFSLGLLSIFLSGSLWGLFSVFVFSGCYFFNNYKLSLVNFKKLFFYFFCIIAFMGAFFLMSKPSHIKYPNTINRIMNFKSDGSFIERFQHSNINNIKFSESFTSGEMLIPRLNPSSNFAFLFGTGISTHFFFEKHPVNGYHLIYLTFGLIGTLTLFWSFLWALRKRLFNEKLIFTTLTLFSLSNYPLFTYLIFWLFLFFIFNLSFHAYQK